MACLLIKCVVRIKLQSAGTPVGLDLLATLATSPPDLQIATLNHDVLVEALFKGKGIDFTDGFGDPDGEVRWFDKGAFDSSSGTKLLKLHGSINWLSLFSNTKGGVAIPIGPDWDHCKTADGTMLSDTGEVEFLTGVGNKVGDYNKGIFAESMFRFHQILRKEAQIVMSGYGWGDRGINVRLMDWLYGDPDRKLFLLHERPEEFQERLTPLTYRRERLEAIS